MRHIFFFIGSLLLFLSSPDVWRNLKKTNTSWHIWTRSHGKRVRILKHIFTGKTMFARNRTILDKRRLLLNDEYQTIAGRKLPHSENFKSNGKKGEKDWKKRILVISSRATKCFIILEIVLNRSTGLNTSK